MRNLLALVREATHLLAPLTANCRTFHDRWAAGAAADAPAGRWAGEWRSLANGHHGPLRCVVDVMDERQWQATFHAGYALVFRACYATFFTVARSGDRWTFSGHSDLGKLAGGHYEYDGEATPHSFMAHYRSRYDHGVFTMTRDDAGKPR